MFNIFIIGPSQCGKTTIAKKVSEYLSMPTISASDWVRKSFIPSSKNLDKAEFIKEITDYSVAYLKGNPNACIDFMLKQTPNLLMDKGFIIEGNQNPKDFLALFNPTTDFVAIISFKDKQPHTTKFENNGIKIIEASLKWFEKDCKLTRPIQIMNWGIGNKADVDSTTSTVNEILTRVNLWNKNV